VAPVQLAPVSREAIRRVVAADGVLYARDQAAVTPKISAPVEKFLVNRGDHVTQGQLLAVLESRDLAGAAAEGSPGRSSRGQLPRNDWCFGSGGDCQVSRRGAGHPAAVDAAQKLFESRQKLFTKAQLPVGWG